MRQFALAVALVLVPLVAQAQAGRGTDAVLEALRVERLLAIMQGEAVAASGDLAAAMLPATQAEAWATRVAELNAPARLRPLVSRRFAAAIDAGEIPGIRRFLESPLGQRIVDLELSAREALTEPGIEAAVLERHARLLDEDLARAGLLAEFVRINDLVERNVVGALNSNVAFLRGLGEGAEATGAEVPLDTGDIVAEAWQREPEIRAATQEWVTAFTALAYQPLGDDEFAAYVAFSESSAGQALNEALFAAFDAAFVAVSRDTGRALAEMLATEEL